MKKFCVVMKLSQMWNKIIEIYGKFGKRIILILDIYKLLCLLNCKMDNRTFNLGNVILD